MLVFILAFIMSRSFYFPICLLLPALGIANTFHSSAASDFSALKAHWNFDEGRDWHNMAFPFQEPVQLARDSVGGNDLQLNDNLDPVQAWISGRQFSGIRFSGSEQFLKSRKNLNFLKGSSTLSIWVKTSAIGTDNPATMPAIIGDKDGMIWGALTTDGKLAIIQQGEVITTTAVPINDDEWHHVVFLRRADDGLVAIYLDGTSSGQGKGIQGAISGTYSGFGSAHNGGQFLGAIDQIHIFDKTISTDTIKILKENHAPKAYAQETIVSRGTPSLTGSILHLYTFDPDQDTLSVSKFGQGQSGKVKYNGDGTFYYTSTDGFNQEDSFPVTVTDGKGGFSTTDMIVRDESTIPKIPVTKFTAFRELQPIGQGKTTTGSRIPAIFDWDGNKKNDLLVCGNGYIWAYKNLPGQHINQFADPVTVMNPDGTPIEATSIAVLKQPRRKHPILVVRTSNGLLKTMRLQSSATNGPVFKEIGTITSESGEPFVCPSDAFVFEDFDNNGHMDLLVGNTHNGIYLYKNVSKTDDIKLSNKSEHIVPGSYNMAPYTADLNQDGHPELLHGINWGSIHYWLNKGGKTIIADSLKGDILITDTKGNEPRKDNRTALRHMNGTHGALADFNEDGVLDIVLGGYNEGMLAIAQGVHPNTAAKNLDKIAAIYKKYGNNLGPALEADNQKLLNLYKNLNREWITWAISLPTIEYREKAYQMLKEHIANFPFLKRKCLKDAWFKQENGQVQCGAMHHVPGIFVMNWTMLHCMKPDSAAHRLDVANTLELKGLDRKRYLESGLALADNHKSSEGQLLSIRDFMKYHPRILFPDDHISLDRNMGDGRDAISYVFKSNKNTFGCDVGSPACESAGDLRAAAEKYLGKDSATGDYFTFVMAHEVCHSLDAYVMGRANKDLARRWFDMLVFAANNGGQEDIIVSDQSGWYDLAKTQQRFKEKKLWDGSSPWNDAWNNYWKSCPYKDFTFMRGNIDWFLGARQESLATQANHHWAGSEARLVGALDRYNRGFKANINEVVLFLDFLSAGLNELPMYKIKPTQNPNRANFYVDKAWLERNDKGYITKITIGPRVYKFKIDEQGRVVDIVSHPFIKEMANQQK